MTEILFILTVLFAAYLAYSLSGEQRATIKPVEQVAKPQPVETVAIAVKTEPAPAPAARLIPTEPAPVTTPVIAVKTPAVKSVKPIQKPAVIQNTDTIKREIRNPKTGEIATPHGNYQFTKRWIKEALVAEGLLDKIYKSAELTTAIEQDIKVATAKLAQLDNYKV
jgi:hypothetical protein